MWTEKCLKQKLGNKNLLQETLHKKMFAEFQDFMIKLRYVFMFLKGNVKHRWPLL